jgi:hypothetical protein
MNVPMTQLIGDAFGVAALAVWLAGDAMPRAVFTGAVDPLDGVTNLCLSVLDLAMFAGHALLLIRVKGMRTRRAVLMACCFAGSVALDQLSVAMAVYGIEDTWLIVHPFWSVPFTLLGLASTYPYTLPRVDHGRLEAWWVTCLRIVVPVVICLALLHGAMVNDDPVSRIVALTVVAMLIVRQAAMSLGEIIERR